MRTEKELELINTMQIDISTSCGKARSILRNVIGDYFETSPERFKQSEEKQQMLIESFENIANLLYAADDYIYRIKQIADNIK